MGKIGDIGIVLSLGIVGGVLFMFATGRWKFPDLGDLLKGVTPELGLPTVTEVIPPTVTGVPPRPVIAGIAVPTPMAIGFGALGITAEQLGVTISPLAATFGLLGVAVENLLKGVAVPTPTPAPVVRPREIPLVEAIMEKKALPPYDPMRGLQLQMRP